MSLRPALLALCALLAAPRAAGECPDSCNGHGRCVGPSQCQCFSQWEGPSCADRECAVRRRRRRHPAARRARRRAAAAATATTRAGSRPSRYLECCAGICPSGPAWASLGSGVDVAHVDMVCSNRGVCNTKTGICECQEGFEGLSCNRCA